MAPTVASKSHRTSLRSSVEPRPVRTVYFNTPRSCNDRNEDDNANGSRIGRDETHYPTQSDTSRRIRNSQHVLRQPRVILDIIGQPPPTIQLGELVQIDLLVSVGFASRSTVAATRNSDSSSLFAVASLVAETRSGERMSLEAGFLTAQKMFDSIHPIPDNCLELPPHDQACRAPLGYSSFPSLLIRQAGTYRLRITLLQMTATEATSLSYIDSEPIKVERRGTLAQR